MKTIALLVLLSVPPVSAQGPLEEASRSSKVDVALGVTSLSAASIATGLTASCLSAGTCREVMPLMRRWTDDSIPKAVVIRSAVQAGIHYAVYRFVPEGKWRTRTLAVLAVVNVADALHDMRVVRRLERGR